MVVCEGSGWEGFRRSGGSGCDWETMSSFMHNNIQDVMF